MVLIVTLLLSFVDILTTLPILIFSSHFFCLFLFFAIFKIVDPFPHEYSLVACIESIRKKKISSKIIETFFACWVQSLLLFFPSYFLCHFFFSSFVLYNFFFLLLLLLWQNLYESSSCCAMYTKSAMKDYIKTFREYASLTVSSMCTNICTRHLPLFVYVKLQ